MDDLNMANGQPTAELPPEPSTGENAPAAVQPAAEMPALDIAPETPTPVAQEPVAQEPVAQEPVAQEPVAQEPVVQEPVVQAIVEETKEKPVEVTEEKPVEGQKSDKMDWFILKVQSNREESIREGLMRRVAIAGLDYFFGEIIVPTEKVTEFKGGKKKVIKRKLYPGYLVVHMEINDDTWFLVRETPGIGDFTGAAGHPSPMLPHEVARIVAKQEEKSEKAPKLKIAFREGERVKIKEGTFESFEGDVDSIDETNGRVTVMINIFGRSTPVELEYWQIEAL
jgi:transcriptional antiterminator NusG